MWRLPCDFQVSAPHAGGRSLAYTFFRVRGQERGVFLEQVCTSGDSTLHRAFRRGFWFYVTDVTCCDICACRLPLRRMFSHVQHGLRRSTWVTIGTRMRRQTEDRPHRDQEQEEEWFCQCGLQEEPWDRGESKRCRPRSAH